MGPGAVFEGRPSLPHGLHGVFISRFAVIGPRCRIYQNVTIGEIDRKAPRIGADCLIGAGRRAGGRHPHRKQRKDRGGRRCQPGRARRLHRGGPAAPDPGREGYAVTDIARSRAWRELDLDALAHNARILSAALAPGCSLMAVVKADAYGHGAGPL